MFVCGIRPHFIRNHLQNFVFRVLSVEGQSLKIKILFLSCDEMYLNFPEVSLTIRFMNAGFHPGKTTVCVLGLFSLSEMRWKDNKNHLPEHHILEIRGYISWGVLCTLQCVADFAQRSPGGERGIFFKW